MQQRVVHNTLRVAIVCAVDYRAAQYPNNMHTLAKWVWGLYFEFICGPDDDDRACLVVYRCVCALSVRCQLRTDLISTPLCVRVKLECM